MPERQRLSDQNVAIAVVVVVVQIGAAETGGADGDLEVRGIWGWKRAGFLQIDLISYRRSSAAVDLPVEDLWRRVALRP